MIAKYVKRTAVLAGVIGAAMLAVTLVPTAAQANVSNPPKGSQPGNLTLNPTSGTFASAPTFSTSTGCPAGFQANATLEVLTDGVGDQQISNPVIGPQTPNPFSGTLFAGLTMADVFNLPVGPLGETYEFVIDCHATAGVHGVYVQSTFVTFNTDGNTWTSSPTPPAGAVATTTSLVATPQTVVQGGNVALTATVTGTGAAGNVEFFNGTVSLGVKPLSAGTASLTLNTLAPGDNPITAKFEPTDATKFTASTSSVVTVHVVASGGDTGTESISVNVPLSQGVFTMTVSSTAVQLTDAVNKGTFFESTGTLSDVTVSDGRVQTTPGWSVSGQVSDFSSTVGTFSGNALGWTPNIKTPNAANDVTPGPTVAPNAPGLKTGSALATAPTPHGTGTTVLNAALDLQIPVTTKNGAYSAVLTLTAVESA
jgi:hypothetical protein